MDDVSAAVGNDACTMCGGTGRVKATPSVAIESHEPAKETACPHCGGTGKVEEKPHEG